MIELESLIILNMTYNIGSVRLKALLEAFGSGEKALNASFDKLKRVEGIGPIAAQAIVEVYKNSKSLLEQEFKLIKKHNARVMAFSDDDYPELLKNIYDPPIVLYKRGEYKDSGEQKIAVVGSRQASRYGIEQAENFSYWLAHKGVTIISGLARGIDSASHRGALMARGRTIACLGSGLARIYPPENKNLAEEITHQGAIFSEFPMEAEPRKENFPRRNRIISGLASGVLVIEAALKSGALITAHCALEEGRDVFALPGKVSSPNSVGTLNLIKDGARMVTVPEEIASAASGGLAMTGHSAMTGAGAGGLSLIENNILEILKKDEATIEELVTETDLTAPELSSILTRLELNKQIKKLPGGIYGKAKKIPSNS